jgi:hypothetical protein
MLSVRIDDLDFLRIESSGAWDYNAAYTVSGGDVGKIRAQVRVSAGVETSVTGSTLSAGWHHVQTVRESSTVLKVYLDGSAMPDITVTQDTAVRTTAANDVVFGYETDSRLALIRVHTAALSHAERLAERYSLTAAKTSDLWGDWPLGVEPYVGQFPDVSGNSRDANFEVGAPTYAAGPFIEDHFVTVQFVAA